MEVQMTLEQSDVPDQPEPASSFRKTCRAFAAAILLLVAAQPRSKGSLVIAGGGSLPQEVKDRFLELAGGPSAKIVLIPTASEDADDPEKTVSHFWSETRAQFVEILHTRDRAQANDPNFLRPLTTARGVWIPGGKQAWFSEAYAGTRVETELKGVLERGGVVGGTSAGAAVIPTVSIQQGNPFATTGTGLGLPPFEKIIVDQHFTKRNREERLLKVLENQPEFTGLGIDEGTAVIVEPHRAYVLGNESVHYYPPRSAGTSVSRTIFKAGEEIPMPLMDRAETRAP
jgi:cyanophycinase